MGFLDEAVSKAKETLDVVGKKTNEVVNVQKQKFDVSALESKKEKDFAALGRIYYDIVRTDETAPSEVKALVCAIRDKDDKIDALNYEIAQYRNKRICPNCGASIDKNSVFCNVCGTKLVISDEDDEPTGI